MTQLIKRRWASGFWLAIALIAFSPVSLADDQKGETEDAAIVATASPEAQGQQQGYSAPEGLLDRPRKTQPGGTRAAVSPATAYSMVPPHVASTASQQPVLWWYLDVAPRSDVTFEFTLINNSDKEVIQPLIDRDLGLVEEPGFHALDLAAFGVRLEPGIEYRWSVEIREGSKRREPASGYIELRDSSLSGSAAGAVTAPAYAEAGLWYDAFDRAQQDIAAHPGDARYVQYRDELLRQADQRLTAIIEH